MTPAERRMWFEILKNLPYHFLRQRVIGNYIANFYCASHHLVIEVEGNSHFTMEARVYDAEQSAFFESLGIRVIRFTNDEVMGIPDGVFENLKVLLKSKEI
jgi:very-short-patch-repair endonuclease